MNDLVATGVLSPDQLVIFAAQLDQQRRFRFEQLHQRPVTTPARRSPTAADREVSDILAQGARLALADIDAAQRRLREGSYGRCVDCHAPVSLDRLEAQPSVARCLPCDRAATPPGP